MGTTRPGPGGSRLWLVVPLALAGLLAVIYLVTAPASPDHAAQIFRTELFRDSGFTTWDNYWFGGHYLPTYSLLAPPLGAFLGSRLMGALAVVGSVVLFALITRRQWGEAARYGVIWFAFSATTSLFAGRLTFALGVLFGAAAIYAAQTGRRVLSLILAGVTSLASPVAALFLACLGFSHYLTGRLEGRTNRRGLELATVAFGISLAVALLFPGGGSQPYATSSFLTTLGLTLAALAFIPSDQRLIRIGTMVYAGSLIAAFLIPTPMGGNANRLGTLLLGPLLVISVTASETRPGRLRTLMLGLLSALIVVWQVNPVIRDLKRVDDQPAATPSFYAPLKRALRPRLAARPARVEVVPGISHWESAWTAPAFPLARGWERQADRRLNPIFYSDRRLAPATYRRWLDRLAVGWVAVPEADLDYASRREAALVLNGLDYLKEVPVDGKWRLFRVLDPTPLVARPARLTSLTTSAFTVTAPRTGSFKVRIRHSPYFRVTRGRGCVGPTPGGWTRIRFTAPGRLRVESRFSPIARFRNGESCHP